jgi:hypothetical protein
MRLILSLVLISVVALPAQAACYSRAEAEAEQGLRIHSELMIIGLNCMGIMKNPQLYSQYRNFTRQNEPLIVGWESTLINYFQREGGRGETQFHDFRTRMANQISADVARMRPDVFCHNNASRMGRALGMSQNDLLQWASTNYRGMPPSRPLCASASR